MASVTNSTGALDFRTGIEKVSYAASASKALELGLPPDEEPLCHLVKAISARRLGNTSESDSEALEFLKSRREEGGGL